jgi:ribosomal protein S18 acetylase RimI-like enzyme
VEIRRLSSADAAAFQALRLRGLRENPEAFGSTYAEERDRPLDAVAERLGRDAESSFVLGAALASDGPLVGLTGCYRESSRKRRHVAIIWGMFVAPEARGRGIGGALLDAAIAVAAEWPGVEQITLTVVTEKAAARALYASRGFISFGMEPRALRDESRHYDMEYLWRPLGTRREH